MIPWSFGVCQVATGKLIPVARRSFVNGEDDFTSTGLVVIVLTCKADFFPSVPLLSQLLNGFLTDILDVLGRSVVPFRSEFDDEFVVRLAWHGYMIPSLKTVCQVFRENFTS